MIHWNWKALFNEGRWVLWWSVVNGLALGGLLYLLRYG